MGNPIFSDVLVNFGAQLSAYGARTDVVLGAGENALIPKGWYLMENDADTKVQFTYNSGANYVDLVAASGKGYVFSDGKAFRILATAGGTCQQTQVKGAF
jgi:hypothetical protein